MPMCFLVQDRKLIDVAMGTSTAYLYRPPTVARGINYAITRPPGGSAKHLIDIPCIDCRKHCTSVEDLGVPLASHAM